MIDGLPTFSDVTFHRTIRLVSTARLRDAVLLDLVPKDDLDALAEIEGATSNRLVAQARGAADVSSYEMVYGVPNASFINAAFAYAKPGELSRFSGMHRGAWYAGLKLETSIAEVRFHMTEFLSRTGVYHAVVDYSEMFASFVGNFLDLRDRTEHPCLSPNKDAAYPIGNALAEAARAEGLAGIVYPSVRHEIGTCLVALVPHTVQAVTQGSVYCFTWTGSPTPIIAKVT
jgi:hypothetical protein